MESFDAVRALARTKHYALRSESDGVAAAASLLERADKDTGFTRHGVPAGDPLLQGGEAILVPSVSSIFFNKSVDPELAAFYQAHEYGHHWLDDAAAEGCSGRELNVNAPEERADLGLQRIEGYGPRERRETQANVFAREFLLPTPEARRLYVEQKLGASDIAKRLGILVAVVYHQLALALLVPEYSAKPTDGDYAKPIPPLDKSQKEAAEVQTGPFLLEAGPGTGKTRTLVSRVEILLQRNVDPTKILALTFSNKAAGEMRERVALSSPAAATALWAGTFHAFGLEILRKWGHLVGLPKELRVLDPSDALLMLEQELPNLPLRHYLRLNDPALDLLHILNAISRAKDELVTPERYRSLGEEMLAKAGADEEAQDAAEKVLEVAAIYERYESLLRRDQVVDFADLINRSIELMRAHPAAQDELRQRYTHVLVDEYQDVNRASAVFLQLIADPKSLWVVGDARQSIYRFRGASPANMRDFERDFPGGERKALDRNYRSQDHIVRLLEAFAPHMRASKGALPARWHAERGKQGGAVIVGVATNRSAEAAGLAAQIEDLRRQGIPYRDQAILCRTHTQLARFAALLEAQNIPILYLGDLFERDEIRDLLSLLSFTSEPLRGGLLRVASFPEYCLPLQDARKFLAFAKENECDPLMALRRLGEVPNLSAKGREGFSKLAAHLEGVEFKTHPSQLLAFFLFDRSRYLDGLLRADGIRVQQKRLAIYQFLQFVLEQDMFGHHYGDPKRKLLLAVRRLEILGDERQLRQMPSAANGIDALRMLTVHASKGLEFRGVFLPSLGKQMFPLSPKYNPCPPPPGLCADNPSEAREAEEECLFFVGLSRAKDFLCLSRAERYSDAARTNTSTLLSAIAHNLPSSPDGPANWTSAGPASQAVPLIPELAPDTDVHGADDLDQYLRCPRQYLYQRVLGLSGGRDDTAYVNFHVCVYGVLRWMNHRPATTPFPLIADAEAELHRVWQERGPVKHPYNPIYLEAALQIVRRAASRGARAGGSTPVVWHVDRGASKIKVQPDDVLVEGSTVVVRRLRTGRPPKTLTIDPLYALYHVGASRAHPGTDIRVEAHYLSADESMPAKLSSRMISDRLEKYDGAMAGIAGGDFPPEPKDDRDCPKCPQYFICAALPPANDDDSES